MPLIACLCFAECHIYFSAFVSNMSLFLLTRELEKLVILLSYALVCATTIEGEYEIDQFKMVIATLSSISREEDGLDDSPSN